MSCRKSQSVWLPPWAPFLSGLPEHRRRKRILVPIQGYVDESGSVETDRFVFSALIAEAEDWARFSDEWDACLKAPPSIRYFKMDHAAGRDGEFYGFSDVERDAKLRSLCAVLNRLKPTEVSADADMRQFAIAWGSMAGKPLSHYYFFPFQVINLAVAHVVGDMGSTQPYEIFFDEQKMFGPSAKQWYPIIRAMQAKPVQDLMPIEPFFRSDLDILPLQAADLLAWLVRKRSTPHGEFEFSWIDEYLHGVKRSRLSQKIGWELSDGSFDRSDPEYISGMSVGLEAFREVFGFDWPPKTKIERRKIRGKGGV